MSIDSPTTPVSPGLGSLRAAPAGLPPIDVAPPVVAESNDPFSALRVIDLLARVERGRSIRLADLVDRLNATYLDWIFPPAVVADVAISLQANWMADYRNSSGIVIDDGPGGATLTIEDSSRVDPWIARQAQRLAGECSAILDEFSRRQRTTGAD